MKKLFVFCMAAVAAWVGLTITAGLFAGAVWLLKDAVTAVGMPYWPFAALLVLSAAVIGLAYASEPEPEPEQALGQDGPEEPEKAPDGG